MHLYNYKLSLNISLSTSLGITRVSHYSCELAQMFEILSFIQSLIWSHNYRVNLQVTHFNRSLTRGDHRTFLTFRFASLITSFGALSFTLLPSIRGRVLKRYRYSI